MANEVGVNKNEIKFYDELEALINKYSMENNSNTPDFILVDFLKISFKAFENGIIMRDKLRGKE